ncbi:MAG TPA: UvrD-helicase domain-containing protein, partial [Longimicrobiales bacterium]|nr:UvrD-helicase domain-containing protein [Longimicrobiales bacterium]
MNHPTSSRDAAHGGVATIPLQRELILASAGSGKTHHIAKRLIALLARGEPPESILASTFTRKAAGEILDRVLDRLASAALDGDRARALSRDVAGEENALGSADWQRVLERVAESLHRLNIGTLDSFFMRVARSFAHELKLPAGWRIADEPLTRRIVDGSLQDVLSGADPGQRVEMVRELNRADVRRSVHETLRRMAENALAAHHELDPHAGDPWCALELATGAGGRVDVTAEAAALADALDAVATTEPSRMAAGLAEAAGALRERDWDTLLRKGPGKSVLTARAKGEMPTYYKRPIPDDAVELLERSFELARVALAPRLSAQVRALGRFVRAYHEARERRQGESGAYRFEDVTRLLGGPDPIGERGDLYFRLDARVRHILLDEFQDTSPLQWEALSPLVEELLAGDDPGRSAVIVADPKQSIYGWRGAEPGLVLRIGEHFGLRRDSLHWSWRSSQVVLDAVNGVFSDIEKSPAFEDIDIGPGVARDWAESFNPHVAGKPELPGHVRIEVGAADDSSAQYRPRLLRYAAERVAALHADAPGFTIGVLTRTNKAVARLIFELRRLGVPASEEGGNPLTDSAAVVSVLALLRLVDHPGDGVARYHVARTPVGPLVGLTDPADEPAARRAAAMVRRRLLDDGWGTTIAGLAASLRDACDARDRRRLGQLTELAWRWEPDATLRTMDFVALVEAERVEDATTSQVRVMTVHRSKGLEFDIVVLPELDTPFFGSGRGPSFLPYRPEPGSRITAVYPYLAEHYRPIFPEVEEAFRQHRRGVLLDTLSALYVAMTRARHALHIVVSPDGKSSSKPKSPARVVREALAPGVNAWTERQILFESGDPRWYAALRPATGAVAERSPIDV